MISLMIDMTCSHCQLWQYRPLWLQFLVVVFAKAIDNQLPHTRTYDTYAYSILIITVLCSSFCEFSVHYSLVWEKCLLRDQLQLLKFVWNVQGRLQGGSGCNLCPNWAQGEENYTLKAEEFPQIYGSYVIYKSFFLHGSHLQLDVAHLWCSYITAPLFR